VVYFNLQVNHNSFDSESQGVFENLL